MPTNPVIIGIIITYWVMAAIPIVIAILTLAVPFRGLIAFLLAPRSGRHFQQFFSNQTSTISRRIRLFSVISFYALIAALIFAYSTPEFSNILKRGANGEASNQDIYIAVFLSLIVTMGCIGFSVHIMSYIYEFYFEKKLKIASISFLILIFQAVSLPYYASLFCNAVYGYYVATNPKLLVEKSQVKDNEPEVPKIRLYNRGELLKVSDDVLTFTPEELSPIKQSSEKQVGEESTCNAMLNRHSWRVKGAIYTIQVYNEKKYIRLDEAYSTTGMYMVDLFFNELSFGSLEAFGCSVADYERNYSIPGYGQVFFIYKIFLSIFALAVLGAPFVRIYEVISKKSLLTNDA